MTTTTARTGLSASWGAIGMMLDPIVMGQQGLTFINTLTAGPARPTVATRYAGGFWMQNGLIALVPEVGATIDVYDPVANTLTVGPAHLQTGASAIFVSAVPLPNGTLLCIPYQAANFVVFDPASMTCRATVAHGLAATSTIPAFGGGVLGQDDLVYLAPGVDGRVATYDYTTDTITYRANIAGTPAARPYAGPVLLPNGDIMFTQWKQTNASARYRPGTNAVVASPNTGVRSAGAILTADGLSLIFVPDGANYARYYDLASDTLLAMGGPGIDQGASGAAILPDGRIALFPGNGATIYALDPTPIVGFQQNPLPTNTVSLRAMSADGAVLNSDSAPITSYNTTGAVCLGNGSYLLLTNGTWKTTLLIWTPYSGGDAVPAEAMASRYFSRKV